MFLGFCYQTHYMWCVARFDTICSIKKREKHPRSSVNLVKLQSSACIVTKSNIPPWVFFTFLKLYKWYQTAPSITCND